MEHRLAVHVISTLQQSPGIQRIEAQLLPHESGVLSGPFLAEGFRQFPRLFMTLPLRNGVRPEIASCRTSSFAAGWSRISSPPRR